MTTRKHAAMGKGGKRNKRLTLNKKTSRDLRVRATGPVGGRKANATTETCSCVGGR